MRFTSASQNSCNLKHDGYILLNNHVITMTKKSQSKIKILHIINDLSCNGGAQRFVVDLILPTPKGYEICVVTLFDQNDFYNELKNNGIKCVVWMQLSLQQKWQLLRWPDLIHSHLFPSIYFALAAIDKKRIQTEHATHNRRRDHFWLKPFEFFLYSKYQVTVCITEQVKEALENYLPYWKKNYRVISNGIDINKFSFHQKQAPAKNTIVNIGMVGRFHRYKDHSTLIKALTHLPNRFLLHLVGDGELKEQHLALAKQLGLEQRVIFHGLCSTIPTFLNTLDLYVQSSFVEGFGLAPLEAMASGLPVLASNVQGMQEVIGQKSALFDVGDDKTLAHKIEMLCLHPSLYQQASAYSLERCQCFSLQQCRDQYYQTYQSIIDEQSS